MIPAELFNTSVSNQGGSPVTYSKMLTRGGHVIGEVGTPPDPAKDSDDRVNGLRHSSRYALDVFVSLPRDNVALSRGDLRAMGTVASGMLAILILMLSLMLPRRVRDNPVLELERALKTGEFIPYYQPIVDIRSGRLRGAEVLMRWRKPDGSVISPVSFIPLAESSG